MSSLTYLLRLFANVDLVIHLLRNQLTTTTNVTVREIRKHFSTHFGV
ncbi:hypothetical protein [Flavobacterium sp.]|nr:hypothetical protein [Flavobacterium sp.]HLP62938.1 hypothetical protein [Flavobacterium sp.]